MADIDNKTAVGTATAAQKTDSQTGSQPNNPPSQQPQPRPCPQDCSRCSTSQHVFCSTKMLFDLSRAFQESRRQQAELALAVADIQQQLKPKEEDPLSIPVVENR